MNSFIARLSRLPAAIILAISLLTMLMLGWLDHLTGREISFSIFYLIPITFAAIVAGRTAGLILSLLSAAAWLVADIADGSFYIHPLIPYWNALVRLGYFTFHTLLLTQLMIYIRSENDRSLHDSLTGAANWRLFEAFASRELLRCSREKLPITVAYIDVDEFKRLNDTLGHGAGDDALVAIARAITGNIRPSDLLARLGGDEFAALIPGAQLDDARTILQRVFQAVSRELRRHDCPVTVSIGALTYLTPPANVAEMISCADNLMYEVKRSGKNGIRHDICPSETALSDQAAKP